MNTTTAHSNLHNKAKSSSELTPRLERWRDSEVIVFLYILTFPFLLNQNGLYHIYVVCPCLSSSKSQQHEAGVHDFFVLMPGT